MPASHGLMHSKYLMLSIFTHPVAVAQEVEMNLKWKLTSFCNKPGTCCVLDKSPQLYATVII